MTGQRRHVTALLLPLALLLTLTACAAPRTSYVPIPANSPTVTAHDCPAPLNGPRDGDFVTTYSENFDKDAALGQVDTTYSRCLTGYQGYEDTSHKGRYRPDEVLSVRDGYLDWYVHTDASGQPVTAAPSPQGFDGQVYGRWSLRFRADKTPGYKMALLLWPDSDLWPEGELDFPEAGLGGIIHGNAHDVTGNPSKTAYKLDTKVDTTAWHTASIEWTPTEVTFTLDGVAHTTHNPKAIPKNPMHWILQVETALSGPKPDPAVTGHVQVDWLKIEKYDPA